jgi:hypothetical protein
LAKDFKRFEMFLISPTLNPSLEVNTFFHPPSLILTPK